MPSMNKVGNGTEIEDACLCRLWGNLATILHQICGREGSWGTVLVECLENVHSESVLLRRSRCE